MTGIARTPAPRFDESIESACAALPGLVQAALVLLPEGVLLGGIGVGHAADHEHLLRAAAFCFAATNTPANPSESMSEYVFVSHDRLIVIQRGRTDDRLALVVVCTRAPNLALVMSGSRRAMQTIETSLVVAS